MMCYVSGTEEKHQFHRYADLVLSFNSVNTSFMTWETSIKSLSLCFLICAMEPLLYFEWVLKRLYEMSRESI